MNEALNMRFKEVRKALRLSQDDFGKALGVTRGAITNIELLKTEPKQLFIELLCKTYNVNEDWLLTGEGEMFKPLTRDEEIAGFVGDVIKGDDDFKKKFISMLASLDVEDWEVLEKIALKLADKEKED